MCLSPEQRREIRRTTRPGKRRRQARQTARTENQAAPANEIVETETLPDNFHATRDRAQQERTRRLRRLRGFGQAFAFGPLAALSLPSIGVKTLMGE